MISTNSSEIDALLFDVLNGNRDGNRKSQSSYRYRKLDAEMVVKRLRCLSVVPRPLIHFSPDDSLFSPSYDDIDGINDKDEHARKSIRFEESLI